MRIAELEMELNSQTYELARGANAELALKNEERQVETAELEKAIKSQAEDLAWKANTIRDLEKQIATTTTLELRPHVSQLERKIALLQQHILNMRAKKYATTIKLKLLLKSVINSDKQKKKTSKSPRMRAFREKAQQDEINKRVKTYYQSLQNRFNLAQFNLFRTTAEATELRRNVDELQQQAATETQRISNLEVAHQQQITAKDYTIKSVRNLLRQSSGREAKLRGENEQLSNDNEDLTWQLEDAEDKLQEWQEEYGEYSEGEQALVVEQGEQVLVVREDKEDEGEEDPAVVQEKWEAWQRRTVEQDRAREAARALPPPAPATEEEQSALLAHEDSDEGEASGQGQGVVGGFGTTYNMDPSLAAMGISPTLAAPAPATTIPGLGQLPAVAAAPSVLAGPGTDSLSTPLDAGHIVQDVDSDDDHNPEDEESMLFP